MSEVEAPRRMWSVTSLKDAGLPKQALIGWAARVTAETAVFKRSAWLPMAEEDELEAVKFLKGARFRTTKKAQDRGTDLHKVIEALALGHEPPDPGLDHVQQIRRFFSDWDPEFELAEATVYNLTYNYAGTLDGIVRLRRVPDWVEEEMREAAEALIGPRLLFDAKTTDKSIDHDGALPPYPEVALQVVAYARGEVVGLVPPQMREQNRRRYYLYDPDFPQEPMTPVDGAVALALFPDGYRLVPVDIGEDVWRSFLAVREVARWSLQLEKSVLAEPISTPL